MERMLWKRLDLSRRGRKEEEKKLIEEFYLRKAKGEVECSNEGEVERKSELENLQKQVNNSTAEIKSLLEIVEKSGKETVILTDVVRELSQSRLENDDELRSMEKKLKDMKENQKITSDKLEAAMVKLGKLSTRNVSKREKRKDDKIEELQHTLQEVTTNNQAIETLNENLDRALKARRQEQRMKSYYKTQLEK